VDIGKMNNEQLIGGAASNLTILLILPFDILGDSDVFCGRGRKCSDHVGNQRFRKMVNDCLHQYVEARTNLGKTLIIRKIVDRVRQRSQNGGFVKYDPITGRYNAVGDFVAVSACVNLTWSYL
jgi:hypothetical protein